MLLSPRLRARTPVDLQYGVGIATREWLSIAITGSAMKHSSSNLALVTTLLLSASFARTAPAQVSPLVIAKSFNPAAVALDGGSIATITVTNPNAVPLTNVQFSDAMPAGIDLLVQTGGTCSTVATGGGMFTINFRADTIASRSSVLTAGQSCTITLSVRGTAVGTHINTTSPATSTESPAGAAASGALTVNAVIPTLSGLTLIALATALAMAAALKLRARPAEVRIG